MSHSRTQWMLTLHSRMPHFFDISFPFDTFKSHYGLDEHPPLCAYTIPLAETTVYQNPEMPGFEFDRQYYGNKLISVDLFDCKSPQPFDLRIKQKMRPAFVLVIMLLGYFTYYDAVRREVAQPFPGSVYMARMAGKQYRIRVPEKESRLLLVTIHPSQLAVMGEDFAALSDLLHENQVNDYYISPPGRADEKFMRRLIKLITPKLKRRKDFNKHLQNHLPELISCLKGLMQGKDQVSADTRLLQAIKQYMHHLILQHHTRLNISSIASHHFISLKKLNDLFRQEDINARKFFHQEKMHESHRLITQTNMEIKDIAEIMGYEQLSNFSNAIKTAFGKYPNELRNDACL